MRRALVALTAALLTLLASSPAVAQTAPVDHGPLHPIVFPVIGSVSYTDTFGAPRVGHPHMGQDLMGKKLQQEVAADDGTVIYLAFNHPTAGNFLEVRADDGWVYTYIHLNNDNPGTDDGQADPSLTF